MMGLLKVLWRPDREDEDPDRAMIAQAANILQVGEYQLLQLAYFDWFGQELPEGDRDRLFRAFMLGNQVTNWMRYYARKILVLEEKGLLDEADPAYHRYDHDYVTEVPQGMKHFVLASFILAFVLVLGVLVGHYAGARPTSVLPPYFDRDQIPSGATDPAPIERRL